MKALRMWKERVERRGRMWKNEKGYGRMRKDGEGRRMRKDVKG